MALPTDAKNILSIYAPFIKSTSLTFETEVPSTEQFAQRITTYLKKYPWLVYEFNGQVAGYAYASIYRERTAYQWSCECSVYIHDDHKGKGIGQILYSTLFQILKWQGLRNVYAVINLPNEASVRLHEKMGFVWFATYENVGYKLGRWKNVGWWKLQLNDYDQQPSPPIHFSEIDQKKINDLFKI